MPTGGVPPQLVHVSIRAGVQHVLGPLADEDVAERFAGRGRCAGLLGERLMRPSVDAVPPQLVEVAAAAARAAVDDVLGLLLVEGISERFPDGEWGAGGFGEVVAVPAAVGAGQLVDV